MELRHLRYFTAVAEEENVSRAALKLHVSQPGVSRQIRDLEDEIGFPLFERSAKAVKLTPAGRVFLSEAKAVLQRAEDAVKKAKSVASGGGGEIHVGYAPSLTVRILPPALRQFQQALPAVRVKLHDLSTEEMLAQLRAGKLSVALLVQPPRAALRGLKFKELARYPMCAAVAPAHPLAKAKTLSLEKITREPLIGYSREDYPEYHSDLDRLFARVKHRPHIAEEHDGVTSLVAAVESGRGVALVPDCLACMVGPRLKIIPLAGIRCDVVVGAAWRSEHLPAAAEKFVSLAGNISATG
jgi:LysR family transcriptional regulator, benzoate and cis,cis-muconate-responsive activator of ben and cat genes